MNLKPFFFLIPLLFFACKSTQQNTEHPFTNNLVHEKSPYLLQHAHNPVNWNPWGDVALKKAKDENKLMIISVGYAACHWCHVMEHESFEDTIIAKKMNNHFVCIKVDREERPDIDDVYMSACHIASGRSCGWPLNAFALPDGRPFWAGTYFPKDQWDKVLQQFIDLYESDPDKLIEYADQLTQNIQNSEQIIVNNSPLDITKAALEKLGLASIKGIDMKKGGKKGAPKFPMPNIYDFLLKYNFQFNNPQVEQAIHVTLDKMANGGIYDHLGGGFSRYSTDDKWLVPHFEKMLYDNGQLLSLYSNAFKQTKNPLYQKTVFETIDFLNKELRGKDGQYFASLDADSDGEEGKFYVWTYDDIKNAIHDENNFKLFTDYYNITKSGNWEHGNNILNVDKFQDSSNKELVSALTEGKKALLKIRNKRIRPGLDDKSITAWNGLVIQGLIDAYQAFGYENHKKDALKTANFILDNMLSSDFKLNRNYKDGSAAISGFLDDYVFIAKAFTSLYEITFDEKWLRKAEGLTNYAIKHFFDSESKMFNYISDLDPPLFASKKELYDNVIPGSNSQMARNLFKLGTILYKKDYLATSEAMLNNMKKIIESSQNPNFLSNWCQLYTDMQNPPYEVAILGPDYENFRNKLMKVYQPNAIYIGGELEGTLELLKDKLLEGETTIYVCQNKVCKLPVHRVDDALKLLID